MLEDRGVPELEYLGKELLNVYPFHLRFQLLYPCGAVTEPCGKGNGLLRPGREVEEGHQQGIKPSSGALCLRVPAPELLYLPGRVYELVLAGIVRVAARAYLHCDGLLR